jgi:AraC-like DNA-binding protein
MAAAGVALATGALLAPTVSVHLVRAVARAVEHAQGIPRDAWLRDLGLHGMGSFDTEQFSKLQESAQRLTGNAALGLELCGAPEHGSFDAVGHLICHADTLRDAIQLAGSYGHAVVEDYHLQLRVRAGTASIIFDFACGSPGADRLLADFVISGMLRLIRLYRGPLARAQCARFEYARPHNAARYEKFFGCPVFFGQRETGIEFPAEYLGAAPVDPNPELVSVLREHAEKVSARRLSGPVSSSKVSRYLRACAPRRVPTMSETARELGMSTRTLRRRLSEERVSYRELVQAALEASAVQMLSQARRPLEEVAHRLGFADVTTFERAFKRWTGMTPRQYVNHSGGPMHSPVPTAG